MFYFAEVFGPFLLAAHDGQFHGPIHSRQEEK
jgi:hypothetical protein